MTKNYTNLMNEVIAAEGTEIIEGFKNSVASAMDKMETEFSREEMYKMLKEDLDVYFMTYLMYYIKGKKQQEA